MTEDEDEDEHDLEYARRAVFTPAAELLWTRYRDSDFDPKPPRQITETEWLQLQARLYGHPDHAPAAGRAFDEEHATT